MYILKSFILFFVKYQSINKKYNLFKNDYCDILNYSNELQNKSKNEKIDIINNGFDNRNKTENNDHNITIYNIKINYYKKNLLNNLENKNISINNKLALIEYHNNIFDEKIYTNNISFGGLFNDWK